MVCDACWAVKTPIVMVMNDSLLHRKVHVAISVVVAETISRFRAMDVRVATAFTIGFIGIPMGGDTSERVGGGAL